MLKIINKIIENNNKEEANAWVKKYFNEASVDIRLLVLIIKGIKDKRLISRPIHTPSHEFDEIEINVPKIIENKKINLDKFLTIKKKRINLYSQGMNLKA